MQTLTGPTHEENVKFFKKIWICLPSICSSVNLLEALSEMKENKNLVSLKRTLKISV